MNGIVTAGLSNSFGFGYRYKLKLCKHYALGADINMSFVNYRFKNHPSVFPSNIILGDNYKAKMRYKLFNFELFQRINIGKRGNYIGNYIDIGLYGNVLFNSKYIIKYDIQDYIYTKEKNIYYNLSYLNTINYGVSARVGINRWVVFAKYRLSDMWNETGYLIFPDYIYTNENLILPKLLVGVEISFF